MTVKAQTMYVAKCDFPGCDTLSSDFDHGNHIVYDSEANLASAFGAYEGSLADDWGWLAVDDRHYCGEHVTWNEHEDERVPMPHPTDHNDRTDQ